MGSDQDVCRMSWIYNKRLGFWDYYMSKFHRLEVVWRYVLKGDLLGALVITTRLLKSLFLGQRRLIFGMASEKLNFCKLEIREGFSIKKITSWDQVDSVTRLFFKDNNRLIWWNSKEMLDGGCILWIGYQSDEIATIAWGRTGDKLGSYFFPMTPKCAVISHCLTMPDFRGEGLYSCTVKHVMADLMKASGVDRFYIDCSDWNYASEKGILKVGFKLIGIGQCKNRGRLAWYQQSMPDVAKLVD